VGKATGHLRDVITLSQLNHRVRIRAIVFSRRPFQEAASGGHDSLGTKRAYPPWPLLLRWVPLCWQAAMGKHLRPSCCRHRHKRKRNLVHPRTHLPMASLPGRYGCEGVASAKMQQGSAQFLSSFKFRGRWKGTALMKSILCFLFSIVVVYGMSYLPSGTLEKADEVEECKSG
jgi:hypothetical protein